MTPTGVFLAAGGMNRLLGCLALLLLMWGCGGSDTSQPMPTQGSQPPSAAPPTGQPGRFDGPVIAMISAPDTSGDIYVAGSFTNYNDRPVRPVVRVKPSGDLDGAFILDNAVKSSSDPSDRITSIAATDDGSHDLYVGEVFAASVSSNGLPVRVGRVWKIRPDGSLDPSFVTGQLTWERIVDPLQVHTITPVGDGSGRAYVAGVFDHYDGTPAQKIVRLNPNGRLDTTFTSSGDLFGSGIFLVVPASDNAGRIYVTSYDRISPSAFASQFLYRLNADGTKDPAFDAGTGAFGDASSSTINSVLPLEDASGDLLVGGGFSTFGSPNPSTNSAPFLARLNGDGSLDRSSPKPSVDDVVILTVKSTDGSGDLFVVQGQRLTRYKSDGTIDQQFIIGNMQGGQAAAVLPTSDSTGDMYLGGSFTSFNGGSVGHIVRINKDGTLD